MPAAYVDAVPQRTSPATTLEGRAYLAAGRLVRAVSPVLRIALTALGWAFFLFSWWRVTRPHQMERGAVSLTSVQLSGCALAILMVSGLWILHNLRLSKKGRRHSAAYIPPVYERDRLGRSLILPRESALACAPVITVRMDAGNKVYEPEARPEEFLAADAPVEDELVAEVLR